MSLHSTLADLGACPPALDWVGGRDLDTAWRECQRGDWLIWLMREAAAAAYAAADAAASSAGAAYARAARAAADAAAADAVASAAADAVRRRFPEPTVHVRWLIGEVR